MQGRQVALLHIEARAQGRDVQQIEDLADREAAVRQLEQVFDGNQQRVATTLALVGQGEGG